MKTAVEKTDALKVNDLITAVGTGRGKNHILFVKPEA